MSASKFGDILYVVVQPNGDLKSPYGQRTTVNLYSSVGVAKRAAGKGWVVIPVKLENCSDLPSQVKAMSK